MANPKSLVFALHSQWDVIERLVLLARELPAFAPEQVLNVIGGLAPQKAHDACAATLRQLVASDLLQVLPRGSELQLNPLVLEFVRGLTREHELGLAAVLRARIDAIRSASGRLTVAVQSRDLDQQRQVAIHLAELLRQIGQQLDQDRHALLELAERAKAQDANLPIGRRYREVLTAYDDYVAPMAEMMDSGPAGTFYRHLEAVEHALDQAVETLSAQGSLYTQRLAMRQVAFQAKELRRLGREVLKQCSDTLLPLREEIRQHNALSAVISGLLGQVRKRGLGATLAAAQLPRWRRDMPRRVGVGSEVLRIMAAALCYQPAALPFPDDAATAAPVALDAIDEPALRRELHRALPVANLLAWLHQRYPRARDDTLLRLYHGLLECPDWRVEPADTTVQQPLTRVRVTHYPHALSAANLEGSTSMEGGTTPQVAAP